MMRLLFFHVFDENQAFLSKDTNINRLHEKSRTKLGEKMKTLLVSITANVSPPSMCRTALNHQNEPNKFILSFHFRVNQRVIYS